MSELLLIRHGQSVADVVGRHEGRADFELTNLGRRQAQAAAGWIASRVPPDSILASPLKRAAQTAEIIAARLDLPVTFDDALMEINNGVYAGLTFEEARERYPRPEGGWKHHEGPPGGGESRIAFRSRIELFFSRLLAEIEPEQRVAIVAHGGSIQMLFQTFLRLPVVADVWLRTGDTGMHLWRLRDEERNVLFANVQEHLTGLSSE